MRISTKTIVIGLTIALCGNGAVAQQTKTQNSNAPTTATQSASLAEADRLENLASSSFLRRDYKEAAGLLKEALALREKILGDDHPDVATTLHSLANVYQKAGKYSDAEALYVRAISIRESKLGASNSDTVQALTDYACMNKSEAGKTYEQKRVILMKWAHCLFAGLGQDCEMDGILNGKAVQLVTPQYPKGANVTQQILVYVGVNEQGKVMSANAPCGDSLLRKAAVDAAWQAQFKPRLVNGKPTQFYGVLVYNFVRQ